MPQVISNVRVRQIFVDANQSYYMDKCIEESPLPFKIQIQKFWSLENDSGHLPYNLIRQYYK